ncbi:MAG TPA: phosphate butyryltransferase [Candidatus Marinimicrobia bacterium]|nr:phosphate butyryltransferase [Candidatus Neomarinimicrobiota bacterium]
MIKSYAEILAAVQANKRRKSISIAMADDPSVLEAIKVIDEKGLAHAILVGDSNRIKAIAEKVDYIVNDEMIVPAVNEQEIAFRAVEQIRSGKADILMKGHISTPILMKAVLDRDTGLQTGSILSHVAVAEIPTYPKMLITGDGGITITPDLQAKKAILNNMIAVCRKLEIEQPKVCALGPIEKVNPKIQETVDAAELQKGAEAGEFGDIILEGPMAMDVALSADAARKKGIASRIAGDTDVILVPNITSGNAIIKLLMYLANAKVGGLVIGAKVPIILLSRSDKPEEKFNSVILAILVAD